MTMLYFKGNLSKFIFIFYYKIFYDPLVFRLIYFLNQKFALSANIFCNEDPLPLEWMFIDFKLQHFWTFKVSQHGILVFAYICVYAYYEKKKKTIFFLSYNFKILGPIRIFFSNWDSYELICLKLKFDGFIILHCLFVEQSL